MGSAAKSVHEGFGVPFGHSPHVNYHIGRGIEQFAPPVRQIAVDMAHARGQLGLMLAAMKDCDVVAERMKLSNRVRSGAGRASEDQDAHP